MLNGITGFVNLCYPSGQPQRRHSIHKLVNVPGTLKNGVFGWVNLDIAKLILGAYRQTHERKDFAPRVRGGEFPEG